MPKGAWSSSCIFFSLACGAWSRGDGVDRAVGQAGDAPPRRAPGRAAAGSSCSWSRSVRRHSSVRVKWCGVASAVTRTPRCFARRRASTLLSVETCMMCSRPPVASARAMSRLVITSSAAAGMPGRPQHQRDQPFVHHAVLGQLADLGVVEHRLVEHQAVLEGPPHQLGVVDRGAVVAEGDGAGLDQLADLGQFLAFAVLAHAGDDEDVAVAGLGGLVADELDGALAVDGRIGVGDAGDRGEAAGQRRGRAGWRSSRPPRSPARGGGRACRSGPGRRSGRVASMHRRAWPSGAAS